MAGRDANQRTLERCFEREGASVLDMHSLGRGKPDLLIGHCGINVLVEVKLPERAWGGTAHSRLNRRQTSWHHHWRGRPVVVVRTEEEALLLLRSLEAEAAGAGGAERTG